MSWQFECISRFCTLCLTALDRQKYMYGCPYRFNICVNFSPGCFTTELSNGKGSKKKEKIVFNLPSVTRAFFSNHCLSMKPAIWQAV